MPTFNLVPHPDHPSLAVRAVAVELLRKTENVQLTFVIRGAEEVVFPAPTTPTRADELWRTTCFELFLGFDDEERYVEFNFSPSTRWAAYAFDGYREGMATLDRDAPPRIERLADGVAADCDLAGLPHGELRMALTAVIEEEGGVRSFWSLGHPPGKPDFHHPACFDARLPAVGWA